VKEMCAVADLDCTAEERDHCKEAIRALSTMLKRNQAKGAPSGSMVLLLLKTNKRKRTHGTKDSKLTNAKGPMEQNTTNWVQVRRVTSEEGHKEVVVVGIIYFKQLEDNSRGTIIFIMLILNW
jgi:hypothetical protein